MKSEREVCIAKLRKYLRASIVYEKQNYGYLRVLELKEDLGLLNKFAALEELSNLHQQEIDQLLEKYTA